MTWLHTWTIETCNNTPLRPTTIEVAAITVGPVRNLIAIANAAIEFPHAMILGCNAMNSPVTMILGCNAITYLIKDYDNESLYSRCRRHKG